MKPELKAQSKCALTNRHTCCFKYVVKGTGNQNSCSVSRSLLLQTMFWTVLGFPPAHHALLSVVFVCMTLLCSAAISVRAFDNSASSSLPFSSEKIFLQLGKKGESTKLEIWSSLATKQILSKTKTLVEHNFNHLFSMTSSPNM